MSSESSVARKKILKTTKQEIVKYDRISQIRRYIQPKTKLYNHLGFPFSDFRIKLFVDPKPVELWESAIYQKLRLSKLVWLQK